ncbi:MAG: hypothetical protein SR1Q5_03220 [Quinella sp. 1Q5]|nr:hypothetical protein [Quinella sp. 1Q5]
MTKEFAIYNGDCLEKIKEIPSGSADMILDDLPFGTTDCAFDRRIAEAVSEREQSLFKEVMT